MELWEYLLAADRRSDLSEPAAAWAWIQTQPWGSATEGGRWTDRAKAEWRPNLLALRGIARRLQRKRPRRLTEDQVAALRDEDWVAYRYIRLMHPCALHPDGGSAVLFGDAYLGFRLMPTRPVVGSAALMGRESLDGTPEEYWIDDWAVFWQVVFHSLLQDGGPAVCQTCGAFLGRQTKTGRHKKQRQCGKCRWRKWRAKQPKKKMREKWKQDKRNQLQE
jgi:hypothetical protein